MSQVMMDTRSFVALALGAAVCLCGAPSASAQHCFAPRAAVGCDSHSLAEVSLGAPVIASGGERGWQASYSLGWIFEIDERISAGPILGIGYESESGYLANLGLRTRTPLTAAWGLDLTPGITVNHLDRVATRSTAGYLDLTLARGDSIGVGARIELGRHEGEWKTSAHATVRVGSYLGLAIGASSVLVVFVLSKLQFSS